MRPALRPYVVRFGLASLLGLALGSPAVADDEGGWSVVAELGLVATSGNAESTSFGFKNTVTRSFERSSFSLRIEGVRVESRGDDVAVGAPDDFEVRRPESETSAENYRLRGSFERKISDALFWYAAGGWERNRFSGFENRYSAQAGVGHVWQDRDDQKFKTDYGLTVTRQEDVDGTERSFPGVRLAWSYLNKLGERVTFENTLEIDEDLDETSDYRIEMLSSLAVPMSDRLALKVSLQLLFDNEPSFTTLDLLDPDLRPSGSQVSVELDQLDVVFNTSLVVGF